MEDFLFLLEKRVWTAIGCVVVIVTVRALLVWRLLRDTAEKYKASIFTELLALGQNNNIQDNDLCHHGLRYSKRINYI